MYELLLTNEEPQGVNWSDIRVAFLQVNNFVFQLLAEVIPRTFRRRCQAAPFRFWKQTEYRIREVVLACAARTLDEQAQRFIQYAGGPYEKNYQLVVLFADQSHPARR